MELLPDHQHRLVMLFGVVEEARKDGALYKEKHKRIIAQTLGITETEVANAFAYLVEHGMIARVDAHFEGRTQ
jgi:DNA-binding Lrp family transcriptional regulator